MKAEISSKGRLLVTAENELESFALNKWFELYLSYNESELTVLQIRTFEISATHEN